MGKFRFSLFSLLPLNCSQYSRYSFPAYSQLFSLSIYTRLFGFHCVITSRSVFLFSSPTAKLWLLFPLCFLSERPFFPDKTKCAGREREKSDAKGKRKKKDKSCHDNASGWKKNGKTLLFFCNCARERDSSHIPLECSTSPYNGARRSYFVNEAEGESIQSRVRLFYVIVICHIKPSNFLFMEKYV